MAEFADYPAAHSMDTTWFAMDSAGNVGVFWSNEGGAVPEFVSREDDGRLDALIVATLKHRALTDPALAQVLPGDDEPEVWTSLAFSLYWDGKGVLADLGLWGFACEEQVAAPYIRYTEPALPLRFKDVPAEMQHLLTDNVLPVDFATAPLVQPPEHVPSRLWDQWWVRLDGSVAHRDGHSPDEDPSEAEWLRERLQAAEEAIGGDFPNREPGGGSNWLVEYIRVKVDQARR